MADYDFHLYLQDDWVNFIARSAKYGQGKDERIMDNVTQLGHYYYCVHPYIG